MTNCEACAYYSYDEDYEIETLKKMERLIV